MGIVKDAFQKLTGTGNRASEAEQLDAAIRKGDSNAIAKLVVAMALDDTAADAIDSCLLKIADLRKSIIGLDAAKLKAETVALSEECCKLPSPGDRRCVALQGNENIPAAQCEQWHSERLAVAAKQIAADDARRGALRLASEKYVTVIQASEKIDALILALPHNAPKREAAQRVNAELEEKYQSKNWRWKDGLPVERVR